MESKSVEHSGIRWRREQCIRFSGMQLGFPALLLTCCHALLLLLSYSPALLLSCSPALILSTLKHTYRLTLLLCAAKPNSNDSFAAALNIFQDFKIEHDYEFASCPNMSASQSAAILDIVQCCYLPPNSSADLQHPVRLP